MAAMADILKIIFHFFSWAEKPINSNLARKLWDDF